MESTVVEIHFIRHNPSCCSGTFESGRPQVDQYALTHHTDAHTHHTKMSMSQTPQHVSVISDEETSVFIGFSTLSSFPSFLMPAFYLPPAGKH